MDSANALIYAASEGMIDVVKLLIDAGADLNVESIYGTALSLAKTNGFKDTENVLKAAGAK